MMTTMEEMNCVRQQNWERHQTIDKDNKIGVHSCGEFTKKIVVPNWKHWWMGPHEREICVFARRAPFWQYFHWKEHFSFNLTMWCQRKDFQPKRMLMLMSIKLSRSKHVSNIGTMIANEYPRQILCHHACLPSLGCPTEHLFFKKLIEFIQKYYIFMFSQYLWSSGPI